MGRANHISGERLTNYILELIRSKEEKGISTTEIINNYKKDFGLAKRGKTKTDKKIEIINKTESLEILGEVVFENGKWFYKDI